ncbi:MAG: hypothetical protein J4N31_02590 [Chloroflexi bacterium]|nr:hypothetical protein [Chloroflexota bacterium]
MALRTGQDMMSELAAFGERFWAGEAEVARTFFTAPHEPHDHVRWLRHQCYRELRGPGLLHRHQSRTDWVIENVHSGLPAAESREGRAEFDRQLGQIREEFQHFRLYADLLEDITGEPVLMRDIQGLELASDRRVEAIRKRLMDGDQHLAHLAYGVSEGGGAGIFYAAAALETDDPLLGRIRDAGRIIYDDEVGHGTDNAADVAKTVTAESDFEKLHDMIVEICQERLRMRAEMYGIEISEERIAEITEGKIELLAPLA